VDDVVGKTCVSLLLGWLLGYSLLRVTTLILQRFKLKAAAAELAGAQEWVERPGKMLLTRLARLVRLFVKKLARATRPLVTRLVRPWQERERSRVVARRFITRVVVTQWRAFVAERRRGSPLLERLLKELPEVRRCRWNR